MNGNDCRFDDDDDDDDGTDCSPTEVLPFAVLEDGGGSETRFPNNKPHANKDDYFHNSNQHKDAFPSTTSSSSKHQPKTVETSNLTPFKSYYESIQLSTASVPPPGLMSSIISQDDSVLSTTPSAIDDSFHQHGTTSFWGTNTTTTQLLGQSSHLPHSRVWASPHDSATFLGGTQAGSVGFSQLMQKADDNNDAVIVSSQQEFPHAPTNTAAVAASAAARMPRLTEESELSSSSTTIPRLHAANYSSPTRCQTTTTTTTSSPTLANHWIQNLLTRRSSVETATTSSQPYLSVPLTDEDSLLIAQSQSRSHNQTQQQTQGAWTDRRMVESVILDDTSYQVTIPMMNCTVREVLDVIGNPDFLPLWCEPLHKGVIITKSSEGSCSAAQRQAQRSADARQREYDGEWIEATTSDLVSPTGHGGPSPFDTLRTFWNCLGFPSYAKITMFVERLRGQVGLTIGPFPGGITCSHTFTVVEDERQHSVVHVIDNVKVTVDDDNTNNNKNSHEGDLSDSLYLCGACSMAVKKCFLPTMKGYMEQSSSSLSRLRVLVEHGETGYCIIEAEPSAMFEDNHNIPLLS